MKCIPVISLLLALALRLHAGPIDTLEGKVFCGYQGWFRAEGDESKQGWVHFGPGKRFSPDCCTFDLWPDLSEFSESEKYPSPFRYLDGSAAPLFSSTHPDTVRRHFRWMHEYGIDGAFIQRFGTVVLSERQRESANRVLELCQEAATGEQRSITVMYDLTNLDPEQFPEIAKDWRRILKSGWEGMPCAQRYNSRVLVALYGLGFAKQPASLPQWASLLEEIKGTGAAIMLGIPTYWREAKNDAVSDPQLHTLIKQADVLSPWTVGRMAKIGDVEKVAENIWRKDLEWCEREGKFYLPVIFPGFSWHNLSRMLGKEAKLDAIPRLGGRFYWKQAFEAKRAGARSLYVAMFDEIDEGTAIMKCSHRRPEGSSPFVDVSDVPSDHYLWLSGEARRLIRGEIAATGEPPQR